MPVCILYIQLSFCLQKTYVYIMIVIKSPSYPQEQHFSIHFLTPGKLGRHTFVISLALRQSILCWKVVGDFQLGDWLWRIPVYLLL